MQEFICVTAVITNEHAWALAQLLKRMGWHDYRRLAPDEDDAYVMRAAGEALRRELAREGFAPR